MHQPKKNLILKANQGVNVVHESFFRKSDIAHLRFFLYPDLTSQRLREKLGEYTGYTSDNIYCTNGSDEALMLLIRLCTRPNDEIIVCPPTFFKYDFYATFSWAKTTLVNRRPDFSIDVPGILKKISVKTKMVIIDSPGNPCGAIIERESLRKLLETGLTVVIDECYFEYCGETVADMVKTFPNLVITRTFSKWAGLAGLRVGYILAHESLIQGITAIRFPCYVNVVGQHFAIYALDHVDSFLSRLKKLVRVRDEAIARLSNYPGVTVFPSKSAFIVMKLNMVGSAADLQKYLEKQGIFIFIMNQPLNEHLLENGIRLNFSNKKEVDRFCSVFDLWLLAQKNERR